MNDRWYIVKANATYMVSVTNLVIVGGPYTLEDAQLIANAKYGDKPKIGEQYSIIEHVGNK